MNRFSNLLDVNSDYKHTRFVFKENFTWNREPFTFIWNYNPLQIERISATRREAIQNKIRLQNKKAVWKNLFLVFILTPITMLFLYTTLKDFSFGFASLSIPQETQVNLPDTRLEKFEFYLSDGDEWLSNKHYYNAVFQYRKAYKLFPNSYRSNYHLVMGLAYQCQHESKGCREGKKLALHLAEQYPDERDVHDLLVLFP